MRYRRNTHGPKRSFILVPAVLLVVVISFLLVVRDRNPEQNSNSMPPIINLETITKPTLPQPPEKKLLSNDYHVFQSFNNCGPAALSMALSYFGINQTQQELGQALRPYQVSNGDNDDKSVTLEELAEKSTEFGLIPYHRPNGNAEVIKQLIAHDMPVITRTWLKPNEDIGHYRVIKGYDDITQEFVQDDSLQGKNLRYSYEEFDDIWQQFGYEYLVLVPNDRQEIAREILGENADKEIAWKNALRHAQSKLEEDSSNIHARFNLSVALYHNKDYRRSAEEFEKIESQLPFRTLWYQIEPIYAYYELGNYDKALTMISRILNNQNRAFSELYIIRGRIYEKQGKIAEARSEYEKAVMYNKNLKEARDALSLMDL